MTQDFLWGGGEVSEGGKWRLSLGIQLLMLLNGVKCIVSTYKVCVNPPPFIPSKQRLYTPCSFRYTLTLPVDKGMPCYVMHVFPSCTQVVLYVCTYATGRKRLTHV